MDAVPHSVGAGGAREEGDGQRRARAYALDLAGRRREGCLILYMRSCVYSDVA